MPAEQHLPTLESLPPPLGDLPRPAHDDALVAEDFAHGVRLAANHSGDSDSTGAITGSILGALWGEAAIPAHWLEQLELRKELEALADDAVRYVLEGSHSEVEEAWDRYPGW